VVIYQRAAKMPNITIVGVDCHIGSQLTTTAPFLDALDRVLSSSINCKTAGIYLAAP